MTDGEPPRLLDDPSVPADLRNVLSQAARHAPPLDTAAGLARLEAAMHAPASAIGGGTVALAVAAAVVIGGAAVWSVTRPGDLEPSDPSTVEPAVLEPAIVEPTFVDPQAVDDAEPEPAPATETAPEPELAPESVRASGATASSTPARRRAEPREEEVAAHDDGVVTRDDDALARDMAQLAAARHALGDDPARALALVEAGRREFPSSIFGEEREALRVLALAGLDRDDDARRLGAAFLAAHPSSPFAERVRRAIEPPR